MGHKEISVVAYIMIAFSVMLYLVAIMAIVNDNKPEAGEKAEERRNPWYYIIAGAVCLLIGCLLPE